MSKMWKTIGLRDRVGKRSDITDAASPERKDSCHLHRLFSKEDIISRQICSQLSVFLARLSSYLCFIRDLSFRQNVEFDQNKPRKRVGDASGNKYPRCGR
jgi:hypothetical protein